MEIIGNKMSTFQYPYNDALEQSNLHLSRKNTELKEQVLQLTIRNTELKAKKILIDSVEGIALNLHWFPCPACKDYCVPEGAYYCPRCGAEIKWGKIT